MFSFDNFLLDNMPVRSKYVYDRFCDPELAYWPNDTWRIRSPKRKNVSSRNLYNRFINGLIDEILDPRYEDSDVEMEIEYQPKQKQLRNQQAKNVKNQECNEKQCTITKETENCCNKPSEVVVPNENKDLQLAKPTEINLRLANYKPEEISINVKDGRLTISGKREHKDGSSYSCQTFERTFTLPENCDQEKINCQMNADGLIKLNIPHKVQQKAVEAKEIKIIHEEADKKEESQVKLADDEPIVQDLIEE